MIIPRYSLAELGPEDKPEIYNTLADVGYEGDDLKWDFLLDFGECFGLRSETDNRLIATGGVVNYDESVSLLVMIVVRKAYQRKGLGRVLTAECLKRSKGTPFLYASPQGEPLYEKGFDFRTVETSTIYFGNVAADWNYEDCALIDSLKPEDWSSLLQFDEMIKGFNRRALLEHLRDNSEFVYVAKESGRVTGFCFNYYDYFHSVAGPLAASDPDTAKALLSTVATHHRGKKKKLKLHLCEPFYCLAPWLEKVGLSAGLVSPLMTLGGSRLPGEKKKEVGIAGYPFG